ncbi:40S ribosomal protein S17-1 [Platanthera zijinensis]|uniref:40S ribosomal protein S17-1 n=1 Tax=Platanthera zijinensis TaxID=2320716 RepID=A0AAP0FYD5_9ASPA
MGPAPLSANFLLRILRSTHEREEAEEDLVRGLEARRATGCHGAVKEKWPERKLSSGVIMGGVRMKTVKKLSRQVIEKYYSRMTLDFHTNKKVLEEVAIIPSKQLRNKIAGFSTHLMCRI